MPIPNILGHIFVGHHHQHKIHNDVEHIPYSTQRIKINQRNVGTENPGDGSTVVLGDSSI